MEQLEVDGASLEYTIGGSGEPVLLIHPSVVAESLYRPLAQRTVLSSSFRLISYHRRGYAGSTLGRSPITVAQQAADGAALLEHLGVETAHVVGHSYGGVVAFQLAADRPDLVHSLALLEPTLRMVPSGPAYDERFVLPAIARYRAGDKEAAVDVFTTGVSYPGWQTVIERAVPGGVDQALADADALFEVDVPSLGEWTFGPGQAGRITPAVLSVMGVKTQSHFLEGRPLLHSWLSHVEDFDLESAGHLLQLENPEVLARGLVEFFRRHPMQPVSERHKEPFDSA